jgi:uncharacterized membrane protein YkoI
MAAVLVLCAAVFAGAEEKKCEGKKIDKKDVPAAVMQALEKACPQAKVKEIEKKEADGKVNYEIEVKAGQVKQDVLVAADGTILEVREEIDAKALPEAVQKAVAAAYPHGKIKEAEKTTKGQAVEYEVEVKNDKAELELVLDANGAVLSTKNEDEDKDGGEDKCK